MLVGRAATCPPFTGEAQDCFCPECLREAIPNLNSQRNVLGVQD